MPEPLNEQCRQVSVRTLENHLDRVSMMAEDDGNTWDLSPNDKAALSALLDDRRRLISGLTAIAQVIDGGCRWSSKIARLILDGLDADNIAAWKDVK